jgi:hypothetical protein
MLHQVKCNKCDSEFSFDVAEYLNLGIKNIPKKCPKCLDISQGRPETARVEKREQLQVWSPVRIELPAEKFGKFQSKETDRATLRAVFKGSDGQGISWDGRMDVYCPAEKLPEIAEVRLMRVTHSKGHVREERHGEVMGEKTLRTVEYSPEYEYLVILPVDDEEVKAEMKLVYVSASYKTTLKGFGRQYYASLDTESAIWAHKMSSSARSGRFGSRMALALVDKDHPVISEITGDIQDYQVIS